MNRGERAKVDSREILVTGVWAFAIISLVGAIYGKLDGVAVLIFFIVAVVVSFGIVAMPKPESRAVT